MTRQVAATFALGLTGAIITVAFVIAFMHTNAVGWAIAAFISAAATISPLAAMARGESVRHADDNDRGTDRTVGGR